jgi:ABC-type multidrug transport system fused ATPase/permease subunit
LNEKEIDPPPMIDYLAPVKIGFENATVSWIEYSASGEHDPSNDLFKLKNINIKFPNGDFSIICGPTGSGKTLLMLSLLGETQLVEGNAYCPLTPIPNNLKDASIVNYVSPSILQNTITPSEWILSHSIAYVSQVPWLQNVSIKDNILFGLPMIPARYKETLSCCALDKDISYLDNGDNTEIGERGITLSGGQKARVALARAVYSRAQNILMDDILSSVDSHTAKHIYQTCLMGPIMKGRTRILITHQVNLCIPGSKYIVYVNHGGVEMAGCPKDFVSSGKLNVVVEECNTETGNEEHGALENTSTEKKSKALVEEEGMFILSPIFLKKKKYRVSLTFSLR